MIMMRKRIKHPAALILSAVLLFSIAGAARIAFADTPAELIAARASTNVNLLTYDTVLSQNLREPTGLASYDSDTRAFTVPTKSGDWWRSVHILNNRYLNGAVGLGSGEVSPSQATIYMAATVEFSTLDENADVGFLFMYQGDANPTDTYYYISYVLSVKHNLSIFYACEPNGGAQDYSSASARSFAPKINTPYTIEIIKTPTAVSIWLDEELVVDNVSAVGLDNGAYMYVSGASPKIGISGCEGGYTVGDMAYKYLDADAEAIPVVDTALQDARGNANGNLLAYSSTASSGNILHSWSGLASYGAAGRAFTVASSPYEYWRSGYVLNNSALDGDITMAGDPAIPEDAAVYMAATVRFSATGVNNAGTAVSAHNTAGIIFALQTAGDGEDYYLTFVLQPGGNASFYGFAEGNNGEFGFGSYPISGGITINTDYRIELIKTPTTVGIWVNEWPIVDNIEWVSTAPLTGAAPKIGLSANEGDSTVSDMVYKYLDAEADTADLNAAAAVEAEIDALFTDGAGELTLGDEDGVSAARSAFAALMPAQRALVMNLGKLEAAEARIADLQACAEAAGFKSGYGAILGKSVNTVAIGDKAAVDAALADYELLSALAKGKLTDGEKALLDSLSAKIGELETDAQAAVEAAGFKSGHGAILGKSVNTVAIGDKAAVDAALADYELLSALSKGKLTDGEKALLDSLSAKIGELETDAGGVNKGCKNSSSVIGAAATLILLLGAAFFIRRRG
ncbi:MAG: hypothetical protein LBL66_06780 [Clostridiales bacterium]|jgi:hypothetical protein|nr:hypothetical protein [Clostridiales bacterium]